MHFGKLLRTRHVPLQQKMAAKTEHKRRRYRSELQEILRGQGFDALF
jgi:hypothetical protein